MGLAFGVLGILTFGSMFGMGYCLTKKSQLNEKIAELEKELKNWRLK